jgi:hypothetical protein
MPMQVRRCQTEHKYPPVRLDPKKLLRHQHVNPVLSGGPVNQENRIGVFIGLTAKLTGASTKAISDSGRLRT